MPHPLIMQGGMGVAVSGWPLARTVSRLDQLGVGPNRQKKLSTTFTP